MNNTAQEQLTERFGSEATAFRHDLEAWAKSRGFEFKLEQAELFEGLILVTNGRRWVSFAVRRPAQLGPGADFEGAWGFKVEDWIGGSHSVVALWTDGWRACSDPVNWGWEPVDFPSWWGAHLFKLLGSKAEKD